MIMFEYCSYSVEGTNLRLCRPLPPNGWTPACFYASDPARSNSQHRTDICIKWDIALAVDGEWVQLEPQGPSR